MRTVRVPVRSGRVRNARPALLVVRSTAGRIRTVEAGPVMDLRLSPTPAMVQGVSYLAQCPNCGVLVAVPTNGRARRELGACPSCALNSRWTAVDVPVGPFRPDGDAA